ncbi:baseplate J/gp47 family protein [Sphingomonas sp. BE137]|uniref:baseplate J/gp47 family protein n=1 Tax=Sphingomonas sp. BE137 TaxID=2817844 RepID=UPI00286514BC|nr:baseplate J/gp47 family protein [Sphingomonas sp. BE137]MDR6850399.1 putative phage protein gp47/JayE [Sphingomonas sp. BE137]
MGDNLMPFARPNLSQIRVTAATGINSVLTGLDALLRWSNLGIIAEVLAGLVDGLYGYLDWIALQSNPFTATDEYLEGWAALKGVTRKPATSAVGAAIFAGTNSTVVPTGSLVSRSDGVSYLTTADATVIAGAATVPIRASVAGIDGNGAAGVALTLGVGISGISASGTSSGPLTGGASVETDASLRSRMLIAYQKPPQGGSIDDYGEWALAVPGVTRVWVIPSGMGPGSVVLFFMMDDVQAAHGGFPQGSNGCARLETRDTCGSACKKDPLGGVIGVQKGPLISMV